MQDLETERMPAPSLDILKLVSQDSKIQTLIGLNTLLEGLLS